MRNNAVWVRGATVALLTVLLTLTAFFFLDVLLVPFWEGKFSKNAVVPDLTGLDSTAAAGLLADNGLRLAEPVGREFSDLVPAGKVLNQAPFPGHVVKRKRRIKFVLSLGEEMVTVPRLEDLSPTQAGDTLQRLGLRLGDIREVVDPKRTSGTIISSKPAAGVSLPRGKTIDIVVSQSGLDLKIEVPDFRSASLSSAKKLIKKSQLTLRRTLNKPASDLVPGTVMDQSLPPKAKVDRGSAIDLTVSE